MDKAISQSPIKRVIELTSARPAPLPTPPHPRPYPRCQINTIPSRPSDGSGEASNCGESQCICRRRAHARQREARNVMRGTPPSAAGPGWLAVRADSLWKIAILAEVRGASHAGAERWKWQGSAEWVVEHAPDNEIFSRGVKALNAFTVISTCAGLISAAHTEHANWHFFDVVFLLSNATWYIMTGEERGAGGREGGERRLVFSQALKHTHFHFSLIILLMQGTFFGF